MADSNFPLFTVDCVATEPINCGRCKYTIPAGSQFYPVQNTNRNSAAPAVVKTCLSCALYYWDKATTHGLLDPTKKFEDVYGIHDLSFTPQELAWTRSFNPEAIRRRVIDARMKDATREQRVVTALPGQASIGRANLSLSAARSMPPPPLPLNGSRRMPTAPYIGGPAAQSSSRNTHSHTGGAIGYSNQHPYYQQAIRNQQAKAFVHSNELISVAYLVGYCENAKGSKSHMPKFVPITNIAETNPSTPRSITAKGLIDEAKRLVWPQLLKKFPDFAWAWDQVDIREIWPTAWVNLSQADPTQLWFYDREQLLKAPRGAKGKTGEKVFTHNAKPFEIGVIVPVDDFEKALELAEEKKLSENHAPLSSSLKNSQAAPSSLFTHQSNAGDSGRGTVQVSAVASNSSRKRTRSVAQSSQVAESSQASNRRVYRSPERGVARKVLQSGVDGVHYPVKVFPIPHLDYPDAATSTLPVRFKPDIETRQIGSIMLNPAVIGKGSFRTAHFARLQTEGLINGHVVVKRPYTKSKSQSSLNTEMHSDMVSYQRLSVGEELESIIRDANLHMWSDMLFDFALDWINQFLDVTRLNPPTNIPSFRYVNACVLTVHSEATGTSIRSLSSRKMTLMGEEVIPEADTLFQKYINNGSADISPLIEDLLPDDPLRIQIEYLSTIQHILFWKTEGSAYLSDFQGCNGLLTDGQLMTAPELKDGFDDLFGPGNVRKAFKKFQKEHKCSKSQFCHFFDLPTVNLCTAAAVEWHGVQQCEALSLYKTQAMELASTDC